MVIFLALSHSCTVTHYGRVALSLSTVVLNSRDRQENVWLPKISHFYKPPYNRL